MLDALGLHDYENVAATYAEQSIVQLRLISAALRGGIGVDELEPIVEDLLRRGLVVERIISRMKDKPEPESGAQPVAAAAVALTRTDDWEPRPSATARVLL